MGIALLLNPVLLMDFQLMTLNPYENYGAVSLSGVLVQLSLLNVPCWGRGRRAPGLVEQRLIAAGFAFRYRPREMGANTFPSGRGEDLSATASGPH